MANRRIDIERIIKALDITPSMYQNAVGKYQAIAEYLKTQGIEADFYPQGSFRLGTVVRPLKNGEDADYDLDIICQLFEDKEKIDPRSVKQSVGTIIGNSKLYVDKLLPEDDRCWTLEYALVDGLVGFKLDIVPSVRQDEKSIQLAIGSGVSMDFANQGIAITERVNQSKYRWVSSNPKGYAMWFDSINKRFLDYNREERRNRIFNENRSLFATVEEIPSELERTSLQRVIQILKRHRDLFFMRANKWDSRPISAIISTLATKIASHAPANYTAYELLEFVTNDLAQYAAILKGKLAGFYANYEMRSYIIKENQKWAILNPIDPNDNYADSWTDTTANLFFMWVAAVKQDFIDISELSETRYFASLKNGLGSSLVESILPESKQSKAQSVSIAGTKPWRCF